MLARCISSRRSLSTFSSLSQKTQQTALIQGGETEAPVRGKRKEWDSQIRMIIKSFDRLVGLPAHSGKVALPDSRSLYTVLRSPHVDKKSREQFHMKVRRHMLFIDAERHELSRKYFWLKRLRLIGAQFELVFRCKTRLDKENINELLGRK